MLSIDRSNVFQRLVYVAYKNNGDNFILFVPKYEKQFQVVKQHKCPLYCIILVIHLLLIIFGFYILLDISLII